MGTFCIGHEQPVVRVFTRGRPFSASSSPAAVAQDAAPLERAAATAIVYRSSEPRLRLPF